MLWQSSLKILKISQILRSPYPVYVDDRTTNCFVELETCQLQLLVNSSKFKQQTKTVQYTLIEHLEYIEMYLHMESMYRGVYVLKYFNRTLMQNFLSNFVHIGV